MKTGFLQYTVRTIMKRSFPGKYTYYLQEQYIKGERYFTISMNDFIMYKFKSLDQAKAVFNKKAV